MTVHELNLDQLEELKMNYLCEKLIATEDRTPSFGELADAGQLITDDEIFAEYADTNFVDEDFPGCLDVA